MPGGQGGKRRLFPTRAERAAILGRPRTMQEKIIASIGRRRVAEELAKTETDPELKGRILTQGQIRDEINEIVLGLIDKNNVEIVNKLKKFGTSLEAMAREESEEAATRVRKIFGKINKRYVRNVKFAHYLEKWRVRAVEMILDFRKEEVAINTIVEDVKHALEGEFQSQHFKLGKSVWATKLPKEEIDALAKVVGSINEQYINDVINAPAGRKARYLFAKGFRNSKDWMGEE